MRRTGYRRRPFAGKSAASGFATASSVVHDGDHAAVYQSPQISSGPTKGIYWTIGYGVFRIVRKSAVNCGRHLALLEPPTTRHELPISPKPETDEGTRDEARVGCAF